MSGAPSGLAERADAPVGQVHVQHDGEIAGRSEWAPASVRSERVYLGPRLVSQQKAAPRQPVGAPG